MTAAVFLPGTSWLLASSNNGIVRVWDGVPGKPLTPRIRALGGGMDELRLTPGGKQAVVFDFSGHALTLDLERLTAGNPTPRSADELRLEAEVQAMYRIDETGGLVRLTASDWLQRWGQQAR